MTIEPYPARASAARQRLWRWSQWLVHDIRRLVGTGVPHIFAAMLVTQGAAMLQRILLARILSVAELGQMTYVMQIANLVALLAGFGMGVSVLKFAAEPGSAARRHEIYMAGLFASTVVAAIVAVLFAAVAALVPLHPERAVQLFIYMAAPYIPLAALAKIPLLYMQACKQIKQAAWYTVATQVLYLMLVVVATYFFKLWGYFATLSLAPLSNLLILLIATRDSLGWVRPARALLKRLLSFGFPGMLTNAVGLAGGLAPVALLHRLTGSDETVGLFAIGLLVMSGLQLLPQALMQVAFPYLSDLLGDPRQLWRRSAELAVKQGAAVAAAALVWCLAGQFVIDLLLGAKYASAYWSSVVLVLGMVPFAFAAPAGQALLIMGRVNMNLLVSLLQLVATVVACYLLIPVWGTFGAAVGASIAQLVASGASVLCLRTVLASGTSARRAGGSPGVEPRGEEQTTIGKTD